MQSITGMKNPFSNWTEEDVRRHNLRVSGQRLTIPSVTEGGGTSEGVSAAPTSRRIKQRTKPMMNKLESEWFAIISRKFPNYPRPRAQAKRYLLANGVTYTPDFTTSAWPHPMRESRETAWEVKGPKAWDDAMVKLKMAATAWPEVCWILVWKENGIWREQEMLP